jgi:hypothetical protein
VRIEQCHIGVCTVIAAKTISCQLRIRSTGQYCSDFCRQEVEPECDCGAVAQVKLANVSRTRPAAIEEDKAMISSCGGKFLKTTLEELGDNQVKTLLETTRHGVVAGVAGGLAEIAWVTLYAGATGADPSTLARAVTTAAGVSALFPAVPVALGVTVHMLLAAALGIALSFGWQALSSHRSNIASPFPFILAALVGIWAVNFFVLLPGISPAFIHLLPYPVSLVSKVLFGLAAAEAFRRQDVSALERGRAPIVQSLRR